MSSLTRDDLERVGVSISPEVFEQVVAAAVRAMPAAPGGDQRRDLTDAAAATLERGGFHVGTALPGNEPDDPLLRGTAEYAALLATALSPAEVAARLGIDVSRVRHRLAARTLYGIKTPGGWRLPRFQFDPATGAVIPGRRHRAGRPRPQSPPAERAALVPLAGPRP